MLWLGALVLIDFRRVVNVTWLQVVEADLITLPN